MISVPLLLDLILPLRKLGKTGIDVTMLGLGGFHIGWTTEKDAHAVIETAINGGIRFFDTAHSYEKGKSEERYGRFLVPKYRDQILVHGLVAGIGTILAAVMNAASNFKP